MSKTIKKKTKDKKAIIVVYGSDRTGIIYNVTKILYEHNINVLDIKQTVVAGYFSMMAIVDITDVKNMKLVKSKLDEYSEKSGLNINLQLEDAFNAMHSI